MDTDADLDKAVAWVMSDEYRIWSNDLALKRMRDYVQRGRKHVNLSDKDALLQWKYRVVLHSQDPENSMRFRDYMDIDCELTLRELDPPLNGNATGTSSIRKIYQNEMRRASERSCGVEKTRR